jgi:hypothetical protein
MFSLFSSRKKNYVSIKKIKKQMAKFEISNEDLGFATSVILTFAKIVSQMQFEHPSICKSDIV